MSHNTKKKNELLLLIIVQYVGKNIMKFRPQIDDLLGIGNAVSDSGFMALPQRHGGAEKVCSAVGFLATKITEAFAKPLALQLFS